MASSKFDRGQCPPYISTQNICNQFRINMFCRNRYNPAKILADLEVAEVVECIEYQSREEINLSQLDDDAIAKLPRQRIINLIDVSHEEGSEIDIYFCSEIVGTDTEIKLLAADVLKDIAEIDNQCQGDAEQASNQSPFSSYNFEFDLTDFQFQANGIVEVGYAGRLVNTEFYRPLNKEGEVWRISQRELR